MRNLVLLIVLLQLSLAAFPQRGNHWQFGFKGGLDFSSGIAVPSNSSQMNQLEGCASMSDATGQLIFYTDGVSVWNRQNSIMPNGSNLAGHFSSSQSGLIVPFPADPRRYYIFTVDHIGGSRGLCYSVINMDLAGGLGDVEQKNIQLVNPTAEKVTAVDHCNGKDIWVITHKKASDEYYAYLVTATGISNPVISHSGKMIPASLGYLKASPDGTRIAAAHYGASLDLLDFNSVTGVVSNRKAILEGPPNKELPYGVEFSPNSKLLYVSNGKIKPGAKFRYDLCQFNLLDSSLAKIQSSMLELDADSTAFPSTIFSALQLGPDGKIYMSVYGESFLAVIARPNTPGTGCNYSRNGQALAAPAWCGYGLPDFNQSYFKGSFDHITSCTTKSVSFYSVKPGNAISSKWDFGDPASGPNNISTLDSPVHIFSSPGIYEVKLITELPCRNDTLTNMVKVDPVFVDLGPDKTICDNSTYTITPNVEGTGSWLWQDNSNGPTYAVNQTGVYWLEVNNSTTGCVMRDSIQISYRPKPVVNLGDDTFICEKKDVLLNAANPGATYTWQDNSHAQTFVANNAGVYFVKVSLDGCESSDTIILQQKYLPRVMLGKDTSICNGMSLLLTPVMDKADNASIRWNTGETNPVISVANPGTYSIAIRNECGIAEDAIIVKPGVCQLYIPSAFSPNNDGMNDIFRPGYGENVMNYTLQVFNRGGQNIFQSNQLSNGWNGKLNGVLQPTGIYAWIIRYKIYNDPTEHIMKGTVMLVY